jgi:Family of unknown function (DUF6011)
MAIQYTENQLVLQSLLDSGLVPDWRISFAKSIATEAKLSVKQAFWVEKIVQEICTTPVVPVPKGNFAAVFSMFATAKKHLKFPKVQLDSPVGHMKLSIASQNAKFPGSISIVISGSRGFVGRIRLDGTVDINRQGEDMSKDIIAFLVEFNKDPVKMSVEQGKLHSRCCFCALPLKTQESLAVGYGDVCARHWGLPWGKQKITDPEILEMPEAALDLVRR